MLFLTELKKMMDELPDKYLEPKYLDEQLPPEFLLVGELTDEEKRLFGVFRQVSDRMETEQQIHDLVHNEPGYSEEGCMELRVKQYLEHEKQMLRLSILLVSVRERLNLPESELVFDGNIIYACKREDIEELRHSFRHGHGVQDDEDDDGYDDDSTPDDFPPDMDMN